MKTTKKKQKTDARRSWNFQEVRNFEKWLHLS